MLTSLDSANASRCRGSLALLRMTRVVSQAGPENENTCVHTTLSNFLFRNSGLDLYVRSHKPFMFRGNNDKTKTHGNGESACANSFGWSAEADDTDEPEARFFASCLLLVLPPTSCCEPLPLPPPPPPTLAVFVDVSVTLGETPLRFVDATEVVVDMGKLKDMLAGNDETSIPRELMTLWAEFAVFRDEYGG